MNSWHMMTTKVMEVHQLNLIYKNSKGDTAPYSSSPKCVSAKVPWGPPTICEYRARKETNGDVVKEFKFTNQRRETACFSETLLNNIQTDKEVTQFGQRVTSMFVAERRSLLAMYITLLQHSKDFVHHTSSHDDDGFKTDGQGVSLEDIESKGGSLGDLQNFVQLAKSCVQIDANPKKVPDINPFAKGKRKSSENGDGSKPCKMSNAALIKYNEKKEIEDPSGLERELQESYVGVTFLPLDSISISKDLLKINVFRVYSIIASIKAKYDPSLTTIVVCPEDDSVKVDLNNLGGRKFLVVQKVHTVAAFKGSLQIF